MENKEMQAVMTYKEFEKKYGHEAMEILTALPAAKQKIILSLPDEKLNIWVGEKIRIGHLQKRRWKLEDALDNDKIPVEELSEANTNIKDLGKEIALIENALEHLVAENQKEPLKGRIKFPDRGARDGALSIRPSYKTEYKPPPARLKKN